ncbi:putative importin subunit alpha B [Tieghemostelium lacteum]|uniref:Putative importin subunit alpha B n=1 Tax=Tieghemostelium lacteum TaxID=361077 RepID=A0A152A5R3_TIELA|nr:putative importin subunit alpha B [Tieghemostelium lacteum]|eukprot:KYR01574.1 putative importin subunit alpha B [Tieghemostelium lacteum]
MDKEEVLELKFNKLSLLEVNPNLVTNIANITLYITQVQSNDSNHIQNGTLAIKNLLATNKKETIEYMLNTGIINRFVQLIRQHENEPQTLGDIIIVTEEILIDSKKILKDLVPDFIRNIVNVLLKNRQYTPIHIPIIHSLSNYGQKYRDLLLENDSLLPFIVEVVNADIVTPNSNFIVTRLATGLFSSLLKGKPLPKYNKIKCCIPLLFKLLKCNDEEILQHACWSFYHITGFEVSHLYDLVYQDKLLETLLPLLKSPHNTIIVPTTRAIGNLISEEYMFPIPTITTLCEYLHQLLYNQKKSVRQEVCWTISNITATPEHIGLAISANLVPILIELIQGDNIDVQKEAVWALSNIITLGLPQQVNYLANQKGFLIGFCEVVGKHKDKYVLDSAIEALLKIAQSGEDVDTNDGHPYLKIMRECNLKEKLLNLKHNCKDTQALLEYL